MARLSSKRVRLTMAVAAAALTLTACGSGNDTADAPAQPAVQASVADSIDAVTDTLEAAQDQPAQDEAAKPAQDPKAEPKQGATDAAAPAKPAENSKPAENARPAEAPKPAPAQAPAGPSVRDALPDISVVQVATGQSIDLRSLAVAGKPTLLWFWAPHCPFCKAEAPKVLDFQAKYGDEIEVIGLGAQDDLGQAEGFLAETKTSGLQMVWDESGKSWVHFRVTNQPTVIVLNPSGKVTKTAFREFDEVAIREAAAQA
ncbi:MAG: thioredoxin-like domain-containing protein [Sporichthyaceae bacterium]